jgi:hypothetical protein
MTLFAKGARHLTHRPRRRRLTSQILEPRDRHARRPGRARRHTARRRSRNRPVIRAPAHAVDRPRPDQRVSRGRVHRRHVSGRSRCGRGVAACRVCPVQRTARHQTELHDHVEPLHARRLPDTAERAALHGPRAWSRRRDDRSDAPLRIRLPVPRQPVRHRGEPHGRTGAARARPLRVLDPRRTDS